MNELITKLYYYHGHLYWNETIHNRAKQNHLAGTVKQNGYVEIQYKKKRYYAHRLIWFMYHGIIPDGMIIDHIDKNPSNNKIENLRCVTQNFNLLNINKRSTNKSGFLGISWDKKRHLWVASFSYKGKRIYRKWFNTTEEANEVLSKVRSDFLYTITY